MGKLELLIIHCTGTKGGYDYPKKVVDKWWVDRGWTNPGYSDIIKNNGLFMNLKNFDQDDFLSAHEITNGARGWNGKARHVSYFGGSSRKNHKIPEDTRSDAQKESMIIYCQYMVRRHPDILIAGHNQFSYKACPSFDVPSWLSKNYIVPERNIFRYDLTPNRLGNDLLIDPFDMNLDEFYKSDENAD